MILWVGWALLGGFPASWLGSQHLTGTELGLEQLRWPHSYADSHWGSHSSPLAASPPGLLRLTMWTFWKGSPDFFT